MENKELLNYIDNRIVICEKLNLDASVAVGELKALKQNIISDEKKILGNHIGPVLYPKAIDKMDNVR